MSLHLVNSRSPLPLAGSRTACLALIALTGLAGCGGSSASGGSSSSSASRTATASAATASSPRPARPATIALTSTAGPSLPAARSGIAAVPYAGEVLIAGGLSDAAVSTTTVFRLTASGQVLTGAPLPDPAHDAAAAILGSQVLLFGGGQVEGSSRIDSIAPGTPQVIGQLPQALSDLTATTLGGAVYVAGGWNGTDTNRDILALRPGTATPSVAGHLPQGVRYPAVAALGSRLVVAGGELASGNPTAAVWSFDPASGAVTALPPLPAPIDHSAAAVLGGRFYLLGGLRTGTLSATILSWAPGEAGWRTAGTLPAPLQNGAAAPYRGGVALIGGKTAGGTVASITLLRPAG